MPYSGQHSNRILDPGKFEQDSFRRKNIAPGIDVILGKLKGESKMTVQTYRFDSSKYTAAEAKSWLKDHDISTSGFEPAKKSSKQEMDLIHLRPAEGLTNMSVVSEPAVETQAMFFSATKNVEDPEQRIMVGPAMIPEKRILRKQEDSDNLYEAYFTADDIRILAHEFIANNKSQNITFEHDGENITAAIIESWIVEDQNKDKSNHLGFKDLPVGTWMISCKFSDTDWEELVKKDKITGFSIEGYFTEQLILTKCGDLGDSDEVNLLKLMTLLNKIIATL